MGVIKTCTTVLGLLLALIALPQQAESKGGSLGTATVGGTFYTWAGPWTKMAAEAVPGYQINVEVTGGPVHNVRLVNAGDMEFGLCSMPAVYDGYTGEGWAKGKKHSSIRTLFPMYPSFATLWALSKSDIVNIRDIQGKIFAPGPKGGTPDAYYRIMLDTLGVKPAKIVNSGFSDLVGQLADGMIDVAAGTGGNPFGPAMESEASSPINILEISEADLQAIVTKQPSWYIGMRPAGGYKNFPEAKPCLQYWNVYITNTQLDDELAYKLTKAFFENLPKFENVYKPTMDTKPEDILRSVIPVHKGAARYYAERGVQLPPHLIAD